MTVICRHVSRLTGYAPALPTPFDSADNVDIEAFERLCDRQIQEGATALVVCGTTGEAPTLTPAEHGALTVDTNDPLWADPVRMADDGIHPNDAGYADLAALWMRVIEPSLAG